MKSYQSLRCIYLITFLKYLNRFLYSGIEKMNYPIIVTRICLFIHSNLLLPILTRANLCFIIWRVINPSFTILWHYVIDYHGICQDILIASSVNAFLEKILKIMGFKIYLYNFIWTLVLELILDYFTFGGNRHFSCQLIRSLGIVPNSLRSFLLHYKCKSIE